MTLILPSLSEENSNLRRALAKAVRRDLETMIAYAKTGDPLSYVKLRRNIRPGESLDAAVERFVDEFAKGSRKP